jgi:hypothetical protein
MVVQIPFTTGLASMRQSQPYAARWKNCGGDFVSYNGNTANKIIRPNTDGSIDGTFFRFGI